MSGRSPQQYRSTSSRVIAAERRRNALGLRRNGATYGQIAEALEVSVATAHRYVKQALDALEQETKETATEIRNLELERLDYMLRVLAPLVEQAAKDGDYRPMQMQLRVQERRARLLGLDAATKHDHSGAVTVEHNIERSEIDDLEKMWRESAIDADGEEIPPAELDVGSR